MARDLSPAPVRFLPAGEDQLARFNELANIPEISENFETIPPVTMEETRTMWSYIQGGLISLWGIHCSGRIVGGAGFCTQPPGTRLSHTATFFLYIEPAWWGRGIGKQAILFLEREARKRGYRRMECMVAGSNPRAAGLYRQMGYGEEGVKKQAFRIGDTYEDLLILAKIFPV